MKRFILILPLVMIIGCRGKEARNSTIYGTEYLPPRNYESSYLNEPNAIHPSPNGGRTYRVNGSGYGHERAAASKAH